MGEHVVVPLGALEDWDGTESVQSMRTEMEIIQRLRSLYKQGETPGSFLEGRTHLPSLKQAEIELLSKYIDEYRPHTTWQKIAQMLGVERSTLRRKRKEYGL